MSLFAAFFEELSGRALGWEVYRYQPWMVVMKNQLECSLLLWSVQCTISFLHFRVCSSCIHDSIV